MSQSQDPLDSWTELNDVLRSADEKTCQRLLAAELRGKARRQFVLRIYSRYNRVRAGRERVELLSKCDG